MELSERGNGVEKDMKVSNSVAADVMGTRHKCIDLIQTILL